MAINLYFRKIAIFFICQCQITPVNYFLQLLLLKMQKKEDDYFLVTLGSKAGVVILKFKE